jgi:hypothetical protein
VAQYRFNKGSKKSDGTDIYLCGGEIFAGWLFDMNSSIL